MICFVKGMYTLLSSSTLSEAFWSPRYFHLKSSQPKPVREQLGIVRTNCMDNLDRTNVVQAALAKWTLNRQLQSIGILTEDDSIDNYDALSKDFRESKYTVTQFPLGFFLLNIFLGSVGRPCRFYIEGVCRIWRSEDRLYTHEQAYSARSPRGWL